MTHTLEVALSSASTDASVNSDAIDAAILALPTAGCVLAPVGTFLIARPIVLPDYMRLAGYGAEATHLKQANSTNLDAMVASDAWYNNRATAGNPIYVSDLELDGNCANNASGKGYGFVHSNFRTVCTGVRIVNTRCHKFVILDSGRNASTPISNNIVECKYERIEAASTVTTNVTVPTSANPSSTEGSASFFTATQTGGGHGATDGWIDGLISQDPLYADAVRIQTSGGWKIHKVHHYADVLKDMRNGLKLDNAFGTEVIGGNIAGFGYEASARFANSNWAAIRMSGSGIGSTPARGFQIVGTMITSKEYVAQSGTGAYHMIRVLTSNNVPWTGTIAANFMLCETASTGTTKGISTVQNGTGVNTLTVVGNAYVNGSTATAYAGTDVTKEAANTWN